MRAQRALVVGALLATAAWAGWRPLTLEGPVNDAYPIDGGAVLVAGSGYGTLYAFDAGALVPTLSLVGVGGRSVSGVLLDDRGCLQTCAVPNTTVCLTSAGCLALPPPVSNVSPVARRETTGEGWLVWTTGPTFQLRAQTVRADATLGQVQSTPYGASGPPKVSAGRFQGRELLALPAALGVATGVWLVSSDAGSRIVNSSVAGRPFDVSFVNGGAGGLLIVSGSGALSALEDPLNGALFVDVAAQEASARSATFSTLLGSDAGTGFGLAVSIDGGLMGPIPSRGAPGQRWVSRGGPGAALGRVSCLDPTLCVGFSGITLWLYTNDAGPSVSAPSNLTEGSSGQVIATDPDGDPLLLVVEPLSPGLTFDADAGTVTVAAQARCFGGNSYRVTASDGLGAHDVVQTVSLPVPVPALQVSPATATTDGAPVALVGSGALSCGTTWVLEDDAGTLAVAGDTATFFPDVCRADAGVANVRFELAAPMGAVAPARAQITVEAWGPPAAPVFQSPLVLRPPGTLALAPLDAGLEHPCAARAGFPGTLLEWGYDAGSLPQLTFVPGPVAQLSAGAECASGVVRVEARRRVAPAGPSSPPGFATVQVGPLLLPPGPGTPFDAGFRYEATAARVAGEFSVGLSCSTLYRLRASVDIAAPDGGQPRAGTFDVPGPWSLEVPGGCNGGNFTALAILRDDAGVPVGPRQSFAVSAGFLKAGVGEIGPNRVAVACNAGATAVLEVSEAPGQCAAVGYRWEQRSGPLLRSTEGEGARFALDTGNVELSTLVGQKVTFRISADAGEGNTAEAERSVELTGEGLLTVRHEVAPLLARLEEPLSFETTVSAATACSLSGVELELELAGVRLVSGSLQGGAVDEGDGVRVKVSGLTVAPRAPVRLSWKAWVPQAGSWGVAGTARINGATVSTDTPLLRPPPARACGCGSAPLAPSLLALSLVWLRRRRA